MRRTALALVILMATAAVAGAQYGTGIDRGYVDAQVAALSNSVVVIIVAGDLSVSNSMVVYTDAATNVLRAWVEAQAYLTAPPATNTDTIAWSNAAATWTMFGNTPTLTLNDLNDDECVIQAHTSGVQYAVITFGHSGTYGDISFGLRTINGAQRTAWQLNGGLEHMVFNWPIRAGAANGQMLDNTSVLSLNYNDRVLTGSVWIVHGTASNGYEIVNWVTFTNQLVQLGYITGSDVPANETDPAFTNWNQGEWVTWTGGVDTAINAESTRVDAAFTAINTESGRVDDAFTAINTESGRIDSAFTAINTESGRVNDAFTAINTESGRVDAVEASYVQSVNGNTGAVTVREYTVADSNKVAGIAAGASSNSADAVLLARANHTGTQTASTISDFDAAATAAVHAAGFIKSVPASEVTLALTLQDSSSNPGSAVDNDYGWCSWVIPDSGAEFVYFHFGVPCNAILASNLGFRTWVKVGGVGAGPSNVEWVVSTTFRSPGQVLTNVWDEVQTNTIFTENIVDWYTNLCLTIDASAMSAGGVINGRLERTAGDGFSGDMHVSKQAEIRYWK